MDNRIPQKIKLIMLDKGLRPNSVAAKAGFTEQQFSDILNGRKEIRVKNIPGIAVALGVSANDLFVQEVSEVR